MKWLLAFIALWTTQAAAQWVHFEACGLRKPGESIEIIAERTQKAPTYGPIWIWVPAITTTAGLTEKVPYDGDPDCSIIYVQGNRILVVGSLTEVMNKLKAARR